MFGNHRIKPSFIHVSFLARIMHPTLLSRRFAPAASVQSSYLTLLGCVLLSQGGPGVRIAWHRRQRQELRRQRCTARFIGGFDNHYDDNDAQHDRASHGQRDRDVLIPPERLQETACQACDAQPDPKMLTFADSGRENSSDAAVGQVKISTPRGQIREITVGYKYLTNTRNYRRL